MECQTTVVAREWQGGARRSKKPSSVVKRRCLTIFLVAVGTELIRFAINRAKERGCHLIQITTDKNRKDALRFYERLGFKASHEGLKMHI